MEFDDVLIQVRLPVSLEDAWAHLHDPNLVRRWFGWDYEELDQEIDLIFVQSPRVDTEARSIVWDQGSAHGNAFELAAADGGTSLRVMSRTDRDDPDWADHFDEIDDGWVQFVQQLRFALSRHHGEDRRTLTLSTDVRRAASLAKTGLGAVAGTPVGERYEATLGMGDSISGEVWCLADTHFAVTIDELGDALLMVTPKRVVLSVYGDARSRLDELGPRWSAWWAEHVNPASS